MTQYTKSNKTANTLTINKLHELIDTLQIAADEKQDHRVHEFAIVISNSEIVDGEPTTPTDEFPDFIVRAIDVDYDNEVLRIVW